MSQTPQPARPPTNRHRGDRPASGAPRLGLLPRLLWLFLPLVGLQAAAQDTRPLPLPEEHTVPTPLPSQWRDLAHRPIAPGQPLQGIDFGWSPGEGTRALPLVAGKGLRIPVGARASRIHFLHTYQPGPLVRAWQSAETAAKERGDNVQPPPVVFTYRIHYGAERTLDLPVRWDEGIHDIRRDAFWDPLYGMLGDLALAKVAAVMPVPVQRGKVNVLYALAWINPAPDREIESIEILPPDAESGTGHLFSISLDARPLPGRLLYASPRGQAGDGSFQRPFGDLQAALDELRPGDTLFLRGGRYEPARRLLVKQSGTAGKPITVTAYPGETAVIDARRYTFSADNTLGKLPKGPFQTRIGFVQMNGVSDYTLHNLRFENMISMGVLALDVNRVSIEHNHFYLSPASAIFLTGKDSRANHNTVIRACSLEAFRRHFDHDPARSTDPILVEHRNFLENRGRRGGFGDECIDVGGTGSQDLEGAYNEVCWGDKEGFDTKGGPTRVRVHHNYIHRNQFWTGLYIDGWTEPLRDVEVSHNVVAFNWGSGIAVNAEHGPLVENVRVHHNLSFNNDLSGIDIGGAGRNNLRRSIVIENNTVVGNGHARRNKRPAGGINLGTSSVEDILIQNNLLVNNRDFGIAAFAPPEKWTGKRIVIRNNLIWPRQAEGALLGTDNWFGVAGESPVVADPRLVNPAAHDYRLGDGSPALGAGSREVRWNASHLTEIDLGAYEK